MCSQKRLNLQNIIYVILSLGIAFLFVLMNSDTSTLLYQYQNSFDSEVFQIMGKSWIEGLIPYKDIFDLKGPIIFFINRIGYEITGTSTGVFIIQVLFLTIFLFTSFLFLQRRLSTLASIGGTIALLSSLAITFSGGNLVDEYILPFILLTITCMYEWIQNYSNENPDHKLHYAFIYGLTFSVALLSRLTMAVPMSAGVAVIAIVLIKNKRWNNILWNIIAFLGGGLLIFLPFAFYFFINDAFEDWWTDSIMFGFNYLSNSLQENFRVEMVRKLFSKNIPVFLMIIAAVIRYAYEKDSKSCINMILWLFISFFSLLLIIKGRGYTHYSMIYAPYVVIATLDFSYIPNRIIKNVVFIVMFFGLLFNGVRNTYHYYETHCSLDMDVYSRYDKVISKIPDNEKNSILIYNGEVYPYLCYNIIPCSKYFYLQDENASISSSYREGLLYNIADCSPQWIIVAKEAKAINQILQTRYVECTFGDNSEILLYKLIK